ncbi:unnamed protein product [Cercopithifilaria johnstoni]|uniref:Uncharacterized protein n=1 Tax=Cercopithifilaria johnstoni TaxID=2874296 RepID=A0A8J2M3P2_9BILA|nr:unnamed protein product [Cercopithifilaria johnstoni]
MILKRKLLRPRSSVAPRSVRGTVIGVCVSHEDGLRVLRDFRLLLPIRQTSIKLFQKYPRREVTCDSQHQ